MIANLEEIQICQRKAESRWTHLESRAGNNNKLCMLGGHAPRWSLTYAHEKAANESWQVEFAFFQGHYWSSGWADFFLCIFRVVRSQGPCRPIHLSTGRKRVLCRHPTPTVLCHAP